MFDVAPHQRTRQSVHEQWVAHEGLPLVQGHYIADLETAPLERWARRNASGCFINHDASNTSNDCYPLELGALFAIPMNAWHQHFNASGSEPVRYIGVTSAPSAINLFGDPEFIFNCDYRFTKRYAGEADYFSGDGMLTGMVWETNFVADVPGYAIGMGRART